MKLITVWRLTIAVVAVTAVAVSSLTVAASEFVVEVQRLLSSSGKIAPAEDAAGAVDGKFPNHYDFHTGQDNPPWWQVDLGAAKSIGLVRIYIRSSLLPVATGVSPLTRRDESSTATRSTRYSTSDSV